MGHLSDSTKEKGLKGDLRPKKKNIPAYSSELIIYWADLPQQQLCWQ